MGHQKEPDARIVIDDLLRTAGWDPADKSMVETEVLVPWPTGAVRDGASPSAGRDTFGRADLLLGLLERRRPYGQLPLLDPTSLEEVRAILEADGYFESATPLISRLSAMPGKHRAPMAWLAWPGKPTSSG